LNRQSIACFFIVKVERKLNLKLAKGNALIAMILMVFNQSDGSIHALRNYRVKEYNQLTWVDKP
jgi:hypothetical protein